MVKATDSIVKIWRGKRSTYDALVASDEVSYWTHYYVKEADNTWAEYFGKIPIKPQTGQLYPVDTVVPELPQTATAGQRFLVGRDATETEAAEYYVVEIAPNPLDSAIYPLGSLSVRVKDRKLYSYQVVNGVLTTYDGDVICGTF